MNKKIIFAAIMCSALLFSGCEKNITENPADSNDKSIVKTSAEAAVTKSSDARNTPVVRVAKTVGPAVVGITNKAVARDFFNRTVETEGVGSGVIFRKEGYIVTNNHVIAGAKELIVSLADGNTINGELVGADEITDIAVVKVDSKDLPVAKFGNSDDVMVGEPAIGVISALNRTLEINDRRVKLLQTDAAISPGNSGGALCNADGEIIGINSAKLATNGVEGMGFAIPINTVQTIIDELMQKGYVARPYLGVTIFDKQTAARYGYTLSIDKGVYVFQVAIGSPADKVGLQRGDIILSVDDKEVNSVTEVRNDIAARKIGDKVKIRFDRDGRESNVDIVLEEIPQQSNQ